MPPFNELKRPLILASGSPRRRQLLADAGFVFSTSSADVEETFPEHIPAHSVALFLARKKADHFRSSLKDEMIITADTTVVLSEKVLNKPNTRQEAIAMLKALSGKTHTVITGVCILSSEKEVAFEDRTEVSFRDLSMDEIEYYLNEFEPYDKAGAYGIQDWLGMVGITQIAGSYFNVMGLPVHKVYNVLTNWDTPD